MHGNRIPVTIVLVVMLGALMEGVFPTCPLIQPAYQLFHKSCDTFVFS